ncbi:primary-amine oxidase [Phaffia rhodozyma]|uniref:Amine oxidase n=1 Tax=Phaffia rhodozyma TaxID=264483 RepID=A0A0F7SSI2_PHARH|nr:primary-amine oxidase [Phaffia rhodozyma]
MSPIVLDTLAKALPSTDSSAASQLHPLASLTSEELVKVTDIVKAYNPTKSCSFRRVYLKEPPKAQVLPYLVAFNAGNPLPSPPPRRAQALLYFQGELPFIETLVDIGAGKVIGQRVLEGMHGGGDDEEMFKVAAGALASPMVQAELKRLQIPEGCEVVAEPWPYGTDDEPQSLRLFEVWMFLNSKETKHHPSANFYGHPLDFAAVVDGRDFSVIRIDRMPTTAEFSASTDPTKTYEHHADSEYAPELLPGGLRQDLKPIHITQPQGVSFTIEGERVRWQKWDFTLNFDLREGMILRDVKYDGRPIFYRVSTSEMTVPYGDPRSPVHRKSAYDFGEAGAGQMANNLQLGCDCLGVIHYIDGLAVKPDGSPLVLPNTICVHEQDGGIGWKHTNVRTGRADVARSRELVLQLILTVGNYEYALYWIFDTAGVLHWEIRATGIMSVTPIEAGVDAANTIKYGSVVAPGVFAPDHQHIFNLRIDPAIDGYESSTVVYDETHPMERNEKNPHGVGFETRQTKVNREGAFNLDWQTNRVVKMINPSKLNRHSGKPVGYKIVAPPTQLGLAHETSMHNQRGEFVNNHIHYTKHDEEELFAAGEHPWQSVGGQGGCRTWAARQREVKTGEGVVWFTLGFTHATKPEDWPVMPVETFRMHFKPVHFFEQNPALDVAPSTQQFNQSTKADVSGEKKKYCSTDN